MIGSRIAPDVAKQFKTITDAAEVDRLLNLNSDRRWLHSEELIPGWAVAGVDPLTGERMLQGVQYKPDFPRLQIDRVTGLPNPGKWRKYESASGYDAEPVFLSNGKPGYWPEIVANKLIPFAICEGAKKAAKSISDGLAAIAIPGVSTGQKLGYLRPSIRKLLGVGRTVYLVFDGDWRTNSAVAYSLDKLGRLISATGSVVRVVVFPDIPGVDKTGLDDFLVWEEIQGRDPSAALAGLCANALSFEEWRNAALGKQNSYAGNNAGNHAGNHAGAQANASSNSGGHAPTAYQSNSGGQPGVPDNVPPHAVPAERALLQGLLVDPKALGLARQQLSPDSFYLPAHQYIFEAMCSLSDNSQPVDVVTVEQRLIDGKRLPAVIEQLGDDWGSPNLIGASSLDQYAQIIADRHLRRQALTAVPQIARAIQDANLTVGEIADRLQALSMLLNQKSSTERGLKPVGELLASALQKIENTFVNPSSAPYLPIGMGEFERQLGGLQRSDLFILAGRPGSGKTTFALNAIRNCAALTGLPCVLFSIEMSAEIIVYHLIQSYTRIDFKRLRAGRLSIYEMQMVAAAVGELSQLNLWIDDSSILGLPKIRSGLAGLKNQFGELGVVVIDYLQLMGSNDASANRNTELGAITRGLKTQICRDLNVPLILLSQLSRSVENRKDKRPIMSDIRDTGCAEQDADLIGMLYRREYYEGAATPIEDRGVAELNMIKARNDRTTRIPLLADLAACRIGDLYYRQQAARYHQRAQQAAQITED